VNNNRKQKAQSRRELIKGVGGVALLGPSAITAFPSVMAQTPKVLRYLGTAVN